MRKVSALLVAAFLLASCGSGSQPATPTATAAVVATPEPSIAPVVDPMAGIVEFGAKLDQDNVEIQKPRDSFKRTVKKIAWVAHLSEPAGGTSLTFIIAKRSKSGAETVLEKLDVPIADPSFDTLGNAVDLASVVGNKAGTYVLRYLRDGTVLAEGTFQLTK